MASPIEVAESEIGKVGLKNKRFTCINFLFPVKEYFAKGLIHLNEINK